MYFIIQLKETLLAIRENHDIKICEVIKTPDQEKVTQLPMAKKHIIGLFQLRGEIITLLNFPMMLEMEDVNAEKKLGILIKVKDDLICLEVDKIIGMATALEQIKLVQTKNQMRGLLSGALKYKDKTVLELDMKKILNIHK